MLTADIYDKDPSKIIITGADWRWIEVLKSLPTSYSNHKIKDTFFYNLSWQMCLALRSTFGDKMTVGPKLLEWSQNEYENVILPAFNLRSAPDADGYPRLYPHQRGDVKFLSIAGRAILANGMGSGKSQSAFSTVLYNHEQGKDVFPVLIACPNSTKDQWKDEIDKVWPGLTVVVVEGSAAKRRKALEEKAHVVIVNWESLRSHSRLSPYGNTALKRCPEHGGLNDVKPAACEAHPKELNNIPFKTVIGDEIHRIKDPASKMARAFKAATGDADYRYAMSGTPIASSPEDLFSVLNWLFPHAYPSKDKFLKRFCIMHKNTFGARVIVGLIPEREKEFFAGIDPFLRRMPKEAILPFLPPIIRERRNVEMAAKQKKAYVQMRDQMIAELDDNNVVHTTSPLTKMMRLMQFASAYAEVEFANVYNKETRQVENKPVIKLSDPSSKIDAFMDDLEDFGDESIIVFAQSKQLINLLSERMTKAKLPHGLITGDQDTKARTAHMKNFQEGTTKYILCTIAAGGTGITLTKGSIMVFLQRDWSMIGNLQAEARGHRIGSEIHDHVQIIDYVTEGTVEEEVFRAIETKTNNLEVILRDKELMKKVLENRELTKEELPEEQFDLDKAREENDKNRSDDDLF